MSSSSTKRRTRETTTAAATVAPNVTMWPSETLSVPKDRLAASAARPASSVASRTPSEFRVITTQPRMAESPSTRCTCRLQRVAVRGHEPEQSQRSRAQREREQSVGGAQARVEGQRDVRARESAASDQARELHVAHRSRHQREREAREQQLRRDPERPQPGALVFAELDAGEPARPQQPRHQRDSGEHLEQEQDLLDERRGRNEVAHAVDGVEGAERVNAAQQRGVDHRAHDPHHGIESQQPRELPDRERRFRMKPVRRHQREHQGRGVGHLEDRRRMREIGLVLDGLERAGPRAAEQPDQRREQGELREEGRRMQLDVAAQALLDSAEVVREVAERGLGRRLVAHARQIGRLFRVQSWPSTSLR